MISEINSTRWISTQMDSHIGGCNCEVFYTSNSVKNKFYAIGFIGKSSKHNFYYNFSSKDSMIAYINNFLTNNKNAYEAKMKRKAEKKEQAKTVEVNVGDMFHYSYGYSMTFSECYQVVAIKGKTATLKKLVGSSVDNDYGSGRMKYEKDNFYSDEEIKKRILVSYDGKPTFKIGHGHARLTSESESHYYSWMD